MQIESMAIPDVKMVRLKQHGDHRGFFSETYSRRDLACHGVEIEFVQDNHSRSAKQGTLRGLHFQIPPYAQDKLVRVLRGSVLDVAVDLRHGSPTFGEHTAAVISYGEWNEILVPSGFAHGFLTLEPDTEVLYKVSNYYSPDHDKGVLWNDPALGIDWGIPEPDITISDKDRRQPRLGELDRFFSYERQ